MWPSDGDLTSLLLLSLGSDTTQPSVEQLNGSMGVDYDAVGLLAGRLTRRAPIGALVVGLTLGFAAIRGRRLELASALHAQVPEAQLAWVALVEAAARVTAAALLALAATVGAAVADNPDPPVQVWWIGALTVLAGALGAVLGVLAGTGTVRERHLFRDFKNH